LKALSNQPNSDLSKAIRYLHNLTLRKLKLSLIHWNAVFKVAANSINSNEAKFKDDVYQSPDGKSYTSQSQQRTQQQYAVIGQLYAIMTGLKTEEGSPNGMSWDKIQLVDKDIISELHKVKSIKSHFQPDLVTYTLLFKICARVNTKESFEDAKLLWQRWEAWAISERGRYTKAIEKLRKLKKKKNSKNQSSKAPSEVKSGPDVLFLTAYMTAHIGGGKEAGISGIDFFEKWFKLKENSESDTRSTNVSYVQIEDVRIPKVEPSPISWSILVHLGRLGGCEGRVKRLLPFEFIKSDKEEKGGDQKNKNNIKTPIIAKENTSTKTGKLVLDINIPRNIDPIQIETLQRAHSNSPEINLKLLAKAKEFGKLTPEMFTLTLQSLYADARDTKRKIGHIKYSLIKNNYREKVENWQREGFRIYNDLLEFCKSTYEKSWLKHVPISATIAALNLQTLSSNSNMYKILLSRTDFFDEYARKRRWTHLEIAFMDRAENIVRFRLRELLDKRKAIFKEARTSRKDSYRTHILEQIYCMKEELEALRKLEVIIKNSKSATNSSESEGYKKID